MEKRRLKYNKHDVPGTYRVTWLEAGNKEDAKPAPPGSKAGVYFGCCERVIEAANRQAAIMVIYVEGGRDHHRRGDIRANRVFVSAAERIVDIDARITELTREKVEILDEQHVKEA